jgi:Kef-type K+ transport system membrane component KefB
MLMVVSTGTVIGMYLKMDFPLSIGNKVFMAINFVMTIAFAYIFYMESKIRSRDMQFTNISSIVQAIQFAVAVMVSYVITIAWMRAIIIVGSMVCTSVPLTIKVYREIKKIEKRQLEKNNDKR